MHTNKKYLQEVKFFSYSFLLCFSLNRRTDINFVNFVKKKKSEFSFCNLSTLMNQRALSLFALSGDIQHTVSVQHPHSRAHVINQRPGWEV